MRGLSEAASRVGSLTNHVGRRRMGAVLGGAPTGTRASSRAPCWAGLHGPMDARYGAARDGVATQGALGDARRTTAAHVEQTRLQGRFGLDGFVRRRARLRSRNLVG